MNLTIHGSGYVGLVTGACMADAGNQVVCVDIDADKIALLQQGEITNHEPGRAGLVSRNFSAGR
ncbi:MAG: UDP-glucose 6-dehydrogenase, partial [Gammaproteobacteria bacterium]|nr:UDP-glucose 6-dehydrogenase [Gammaproteobacteria bacterium]